MVTARVSTTCDFRISHGTAACTTCDFRISHGTAACTHCTSQLRFPGFLCFQDSIRHSAKDDGDCRQSPARMNKFSSKTILFSMDRFQKLSFSVAFVQIKVKTQRKFCGFDENVFA